MKCLPSAVRALLAAAALVLGVAGCGSASLINDKDSAEKLYADARDEMASGNYDRAVKLLERVEGKAAGSILAQQAVLEQAYAQYRSGERATALVTLERYIKNHPSSPALDYAMYLKGIVNFNDNLGILSSLSRQDISERDQQASRDAYQSFKQLVDQFPDSKYSADARVRMDYIVNALAEYELHVARYYYRRGAFVAAANRAQYTVREYQQTPSVEEALYIMAQSYDRLGLPQLRDDADRVLKANYPGSSFMRDGIRRRDKPWWQFW
ncbi:MAG: outer membrane protein assembly factor BamD [Burkholderiaceae bacterium]|nr:outer membrane protein assembly factor BamD [Burkholderiaceae bacterium]